MGKVKLALRNGSTLSALSIVIASVALCHVAQAQAHDDNILHPTHRDAAKELAMKIEQPFTFAAVGDIIIRRPVAQLDDPGMQSLIKTMCAADTTYANMEGPIIDDADTSYHGPHVGGPKTIVNDLKSMCIRVMTTSNNHSMDGGDEGIFMTNRLLDSAGITHAGSGRDLTDARSAKIGITPKGTVGVVGIFSIDPSSYPPVSRTSDARENWPGVDPLHVSPTYIVSAEEMAQLRKIRDDSYSHRSEVLVPVGPAPTTESTNDSLFLFNNWYKVGEKTGSISYDMDPKDVSGIIQSIRAGKQNADFLVVAIHCHENSFSYQAYSHDNNVPDFLVQLAHQAIDNGADVFVGTGVHTLRGVEIYKGKPIFYGISNYFYQEIPAAYITDTTKRQEAAGFGWNGSADPEGKGGQHAPDNKEVLLTTSKYDGGKLVEVRIYPADLGIEDSRTISKAGDPRTPTPEVAQRILKHVQEISKQFGTKISIENNVGVIRIANGGSK